MLASGLVAGCDGHFVVTERGRAALADWGVRLPAITSSAAARRFAYPCLDWSERRDHMAGGLAVLLLEHFMARNWLRRVQGSRALRVTPEGARQLATIVESRVAPGSGLTSSLATCP
jgi:hypothetical protein